MFSCYRDQFDFSDTERIREVKQADASDYVCLITDFSSILFDYLYLDKPVIGFFPDRYEFDGGVHNYREFYFPLEDGFMLYTEKPEEACAYLEGLVKNRWQYPPKIKESVDGLFFDKQSNHRAQLYEQIMQREKKSV